MKTHRDQRPVELGIVSRDTRGNSVIFLDQEGGKQPRAGLSND